MADRKDEGGSRLDAVDQAVTVTRNVLLLVVGVSLGVYFYPLLGKLRERLISATPEEVSFWGVITVKLKEQVGSFNPSGISMEAITGSGQVLEKSSAMALHEARSRLEASKTSRVDAILLVPGKTYSGELLRKYVSQLNVPFVIFESSKLDGWLHSSGFSAQLDAERVYTYEELLERTVGLTGAVAKQTDSARDVLEMMESKRLDSIAVVDGNGRFRFMVGREDILSKVVTSLVLKE